MGLKEKTVCALLRERMKSFPGKDGIHSENDEDETLGFIYLKDGIFPKIQSQGDGISAGNWLLAENGTYEITTGQGRRFRRRKNSLEQQQTGGAGKKVRKV